MQDRLIRQSTPLSRVGPGRSRRLLFMLALAAYLVLRPFVPAFRLKANAAQPVCPSPPAIPATSRWSVSQATGVYERERQVFTELGVRPPREVPFDLLVPAVAMLVPLAMAVSGLTEAITGSSAAADRWLSGVLATLFLIIVVVRLGWLYRMWRRRLGRFGPCMPFDVGILTDGRLSVAKVERPTGVRILIFGLFVLSWSAGADPTSRCRSCCCSCSLPDCSSPRRSVACGGGESTTNYGASTNGR
jgi:hypothetical protein